MTIAKKTRLCLVALAAAVGMLFAGVGVANAATYPSVYFGASKNASYVRITFGTGTTTTITPGRTISNVKKVCPQNSSSYLRYTNPGSSTWHKLSTGGCLYLYTTRPGRYNVVQNT